MAKTYQGTFNIPGGFNTQNNEPVDDRYVVDLDSDLLDSSNLDNIYEGLAVYSKESKTIYKWNGEDRTNPENWGKIGGGQDLIEQVIPSGGNYNDLVLTGNILNFTNENAQAIITGLDSSIYKKVTLINKSTQFVNRLNDEDTNSLPENRINMPAGMTVFNVEGATTLIYIDSIQRWQVVGLFASKMFPEFRNVLAQSVPVVNPGGESEAKEIIQYEVFRDAQTTEMSKADLNTAYPEAFRGFQVICKEINKIYKKVDDNTDDWQPITLGTNVV